MFERIKAYLFGEVESTIAPLPFEMEAEHRYRNFLHDAEMRKSLFNAHRIEIFETGYLDYSSSAPVVVYLDRSGKILTHSVYAGPIPHSILTLQWAQSQMSEQ